jgi:hypothetical protein
MPREGFKPTIPASKRDKKVHVLDHSATATGIQIIIGLLKFSGRVNVQGKISSCLFKNQVM